MDLKPSSFLRKTAGDGGYLGQRGGGEARRHVAGWRGAGRGGGKAGWRRRGARVSASGLVGFGGSAGSA